MISATATLRLEKLPLSCLLATEYQVRYPDRLLHYMRLFQDYPDAYAGVLSVMPAKDHPGLYVLLDGYHRYAASLMQGRADVLALIIEEEEPVT